MKINALPMKVSIVSRISTHWFTCHPPGYRRQEKLIDLRLVNLKYDLYIATTQRLREGNLHWDSCLLWERTSRSEILLAYMTRIGDDPIVFKLWIDFLKFLNMPHPNNSKLSSAMTKLSTVIERWLIVARFFPNC